MTAVQQLELDLPALVHRPLDTRLSLAEQFQNFHADNPAVADLYESLAQQWFDAGNYRCGMKFLAEQARWITGLQMPGEGWAVNNSYTAFYARVLLGRRPEWADRILTRVQKAAA
jgi:hypothetical protein